MSLSKNKILVIEDDEFIAECLRQYLEMEGFGVDLAENGQKALDHLRTIEHLPSLILLDLMMPEMDGIQFRKIQSQDPDFGHTPVVVMTADSQIESKKPLLQAKAYLKKPLDLDDLALVISKYLVPAQ